MQFAHFVPVRPAGSLYSSSTLKHHATAMQWCPSPDHYPDSEQPSRSLTLMCWVLILTSFVWRGWGLNRHPTYGLDQERFGDTTGPGLNRQRSHIILIYSVKDNVSSRLTTKTCTDTSELSHDCGFQTLVNWNCDWLACLKSSHRNNNFS